MARQGYALAVQHSIRFKRQCGPGSPSPSGTATTGSGCRCSTCQACSSARLFTRTCPSQSIVHRPLRVLSARTLRGSSLHRGRVVGARDHRRLRRLPGCASDRCFSAFPDAPAAWGMAFYGLGSSAVVYARGDFAQPLEGLCWTAALLAALHVRRTGNRAALGAASVAVGYAILTRPVEGMLVLPADCRSDAADKVSVFRPATAVDAGPRGCRCSDRRVSVTLLMNWATIW